jgi:Ca-activated chloride channel family protein
MIEFFFTQPWLLWLVLLPLALAFLERLPSVRSRGNLWLSTADWISPRAPDPMQPRRVAVWIRIAALLCLIPIAAGIHSGRRVPIQARQPEALVIVLDVSSSMTAEDFSPGNRLAAAKELLKEFIASRKGLEVGLILLAASPRLVAPVTPDHAFILAALDRAGSAAYGEDGTALGSGIASAINRLRDQRARRNRVLLVTDGVNNRGALAPADAARIAADLGVVIDTIGIGTDAVSRFWAPSPLGAPVEMNARIEIDDKALEQLAQITGGSYRRVTGSDEMRRALESFGATFSAPVEDSAMRADYTWAQWLAAAALIFICSGFVLTRFIVAELPG